MEASEATNFVLKKISWLLRPVIELTKKLLVCKMLKLLVVIELTILMFVEILLLLIVVIMGFPFQ